MSNTRAKIKKTRESHAFAGKILAPIDLTQRVLRYLASGCPLLTLKKPMPLTSVNPSRAGKID